MADTGFTIVPQSCIPNRRRNGQRKSDDDHSGQSSGNSTRCGHVDVGEEGDVVGEEDDDEANKVQPPVATNFTPVPSKRKRGSAISPDDIVGELRSMSASMSQAMQAPIPPLVFAPLALPPTVHMQAVQLVQTEEGLTPNQVFEAADFLAKENNVEAYISFNASLQPTWLRMKMGW
jgi:hypothetical protein